jgi:hypothetical protein
MKRSTHIGFKLSKTALHTSLTLGAAIGLLLSSSSVQALDVKFGGYVKADFIYDFDQDLGDDLSASSVSTGNTDSNSSFRAHAKQSRFNITGTHEDYTVKLEADLFTSDSSELVSNSRHVRLRHAYGKAGNLLIGQTWSTFMDKSFIAYPSTVDFSGPAGVAFARQAQIRLSLANGFEFSLENPETRIAGEETRDTMPDIVARYDHNGDTLKWFAAGIVRQFEVANGANDGESTTDAGLHLGANFSFSDTDSFGANVLINGGRYTYFGFSNPEAVMVDGDLETIDEIGAQINYQHRWGGSMDAKTTISYGLVTFDDEFEAELGANAPEKISTIHANYRWSPFKGVNYGVELSAASREDFSGDDGDATRLQFGAQYIF